MKFYLGTHLTSWISALPIPLFLSRRRLFRGNKWRNRTPHPECRWVLDSGGFSELSLYRSYRTSVSRYLEEAEFAHSDIGNLDGVAVQDWMCEPFMLQKTNLTIEEHQHRTALSYLTLKQSKPDIPFFPILQGYALEDYVNHLTLYKTYYNMDLTDPQTYPMVGIGSVCRTQHTEEIGLLFQELRHNQKLKTMHGFGVKIRGLKLYGHLLQSADSMAWSLDARSNPPLPDHDKLHKNCANCQDYALQWRERIIKTNEL